MKLHEYQAKLLLQRAGVPIPAGRTAQSADQAAGAFEALGVSRVAVKAQIHAGGRGKGTIYDIADTTHAVTTGGVQLAESVKQAAIIAEKMLGNILVTHQTGKDGQLVDMVYLEAAANVQRELYAGIVIDRRRGLPVLMVSENGGMDIETLAKDAPDSIRTFHFDPDSGLKPYQARQAAYALHLTGDTFTHATRALTALCAAFVSLDCSLAEINPLAVIDGGGILALDTKLTIDDNALFRHPDLVTLKTPSDQDALESQAEAFGLSYIKLDGEIGCMVNGAGLAMATMDAIKLYGKTPANFLDVGGGATAEKVSEACKIILADPNVNALLVNIFGGIMKCDTIAAGLIDAISRIDLNVPMVVRLEGTRVAEGRRMLEASGLPIINAGNLGEAARRVVSAAG